MEKAGLETSVIGDHIDAPAQRAAGKVLVKSTGALPAKKKKGTWAQLVRVAPNLYRHPKSEKYYGWKKVEGRAQLHCLETADRQTADRKLAEWLSDVQRVNPTVARSTLEELLKAFAATRAGCEVATRTAEKGFEKSLREYFDCERRVPA